ncbi:putative monooxygenase [Serpula lacrymans var. lacrymans S7.9]|uniref:Putative monooxygenase n=1 Tax=Serpula lacrymans var. lacrymans (strain S7.9) TaxID=578457 RepID=F8P5I8_SERL9|nr:putative monooxygenase [Serpula lacrymans var. lacrymans S7.9]EGO21875.1 putative monooxygenase [Serpula lacrymans var. lacrymans S7.9]
MSPCAPEKKVVIIGAGVGGLSSGIALKRRLGFENYVIYEKASAIGGCWRANTYPGCASDAPIHWYSLSTDLNPLWAKSHATQPEILEYWKGLALKHDMYSKITFNTKVVSVEWDATEQKYNIAVQDIQSGSLTCTKAEIVISATGNLEVPHFPSDIRGMDTYKGTLLHPALWGDGIDLRGKRVGVVGSASSAAQLVPSISEDPSVEVVNFIRTPSWFVSRPHTPYTSMQKWIFANVPCAMRLHRNLLMISVGALDHGELKDYIKRNAPSEYHEKLIPAYPPGCKRSVADSGYLSSFHRKNVTLNFDGISEIYEDGIITKTGEKVSLDVIVFATGFIADRFPLHVKGMHDQTIQSYYQSQQGPTAYRGTMIPGFPNLYVLAGPNTVVSHASTLFAEEVQIDYCLQLIKPVIDGHVSSYEVTSQASDDYNQGLQDKLTRSVFMQCVSWFRTDGTGKVFSPFPGTATPNIVPKVQFAIKIIGGTLNSKSVF